MGLIRILLVDDHPMVREGLMVVLNRNEDLEVVAEAANGVEALEAFRRVQPDITLMDIRMPIMDGARATEAILADYPDAVILVVTTVEEDEGLARALRAGAKTYLLKDAPREQLLQTIRSLTAVAA